MSDKIFDIVNIVKNKEKEGEKDLLTYLDSQDIHTLNRLLIIFNGPGKPSLLLISKVATAGSALIGAMIIGYVIYPKSVDSLALGVLTMAALVIAPLLMMGRLARDSRPKAIIKNSKRVVSTQKILTSINFVIQEKYRNLIV